MGLFDKFKKRSKTEEDLPGDAYFLTLQLNARLQPTHRGDIYEDPIAEALEKAGCGTVDGGGTQLGEHGEIEFCDVEIALNDNTKENMDTLLRIIEAIEVPKGSLLYGEDIKIQVGTLEGLALYLNGTELPDEVYKNCDVNHVLDKCNELLAQASSVYSWWEGPQDTAIYFYGPSFVEMKEKIAGFLAEYPLCQKCRVEQIA